ncbi:hypothetical protein [Nocardia callitridis]|uniref:Membrane protein n=1 Tax=Nocardia callitridis TaxID=648753 RepID=A0ABP9L2Q3_9NOCA
MTTTRRALAAGIAAALMQALMLIAFAWPAANTAPRELPLAVTGPQAAMVTGMLDERQPGGFETRTVADESAARGAITDRAVYGAIVTGDGPPRVLIASGASPAVAQLLTQMAQQLSGAPVAPVQDLVPADPDDPRGVAFGVAVLPLVMSGLAAGVLLSLLVPSIGAKALGLGAFAVTAGLLSMAIVQGWLSLLPGAYGELALVSGLVSFAVAGTVVGFSSVLGRAGIGVGALLMLFIGNPFSGATSAPEMLPAGWGALGQLLPPGAAASLLRAVAFFDGTGASGPLVVLSAWAGLAVVLLVVGAILGRRKGTSTHAGKHEAGASDQNREAAVVG